MNLNCFSLSFLLRDEQPSGWRCTLQNLSGRRRPLHEKQICWLYPSWCFLISTLPAILITVTVNRFILPTCGDLERHMQTGSWWVHKVRVFIVAGREFLWGFQLPEASLACLSKVGQLWSPGAASLKTLKNSTKVVQPHEDASKLLYFPFHPNWKRYSAVVVDATVVELSLLLPKLTVFFLCFFSLAGSQQFGLFASCVFPFLAARETEEAGNGFWHDGGEQEKKKTTTERSEDVKTW